MQRVAINGFGRIGRMVFRRLIEEKDVEVVAINARYTPEQLGHLIEYDTVHGKMDCVLSYEENAIILNGKRILLVNKRTPSDLPWDTLQVDTVIEATGAFRTVASNQGHLDAGASLVILTAPAKDDMKMIVMGVNEESYEGQSIVSNASCTTNCLAPVLDAMESAFGIHSGLMTTIHAMTNDQQISDNPHKDLRRARAGSANMIPTSTGAARAIGKIIPTLDGKLNGLSVRVPTLNVSLLDVVLELKQTVAKEQVNEALKKYAEQSKGILGYNELPLVSSDYTTNGCSATMDGLSTMVIAHNKVKLIAWYDNEWAYSCRVVDLVKFAYKKQNKNR